MKKEMNVLRIIDSIQSNDATWFKQNPGREYRVRPAWPGLGMNSVRIVVRRCDILDISRHIFFSAPANFRAPKSDAKIRDLIAQIRRDPILLSEPERSLPYGAYICEDCEVLFDRDYRPIARLPRSGTHTIALPAKDRDGHACTVVLHLDSVTPCEPTERINYIEQVWLYDGGTSPRRDRKSRERLTALFTDINRRAAA